MVKDVTSTFFTMHVMFLGGLFNANQHFRCGDEFQSQTCYGPINAWVGLRDQGSGLKNNPPALEASGQAWMQAEQSLAHNFFVQVLAGLKAAKFTSLNFYKVFPISPWVGRKRQ